MTFDEYWNSEAAKPVKYGVTDLSEDDLAAIFQAGAASERDDVQAGYIQLELERDIARSQVASRQGEFQRLWQTVYDYAKRHCWDEAEDRTDGVGKIWDALMHAHAFIPSTAPKGKP